VFVPRQAVYEGGAPSQRPAQGVLANNGIERYRGKLEYPATSARLDEKTFTPRGGTRALEATKWTISKQVSHGSMI